MGTHLKFLEANAENISAARPLMDTVTDSPAGGLWLFEADPLLPTGLPQICAHPALEPGFLRWRAAGLDGA